VAVRSDAANDRLTRTGGAPDPQTGFTVCGWFYLSVDRDDFSTLIRLHASSGSTTRLTLATGSSGTLPAVFTPGNTSGVLGVDSFTVGAWMFVAVTQTGTTATIYTCTPGGTMHSASGTSSGGSAPDGYTIFGRSSSDASEWFNGRGACVRLWSTVLTGTELAASGTAIRAAADAAAAVLQLAAGGAATHSAADADTATMQLAASGAAAHQAAAAGVGALGLGADGGYLHLATAAGGADLALQASGTVGSGSGQQSGTAVLALDVAGAHTAVRAAAAAAVLVLDASGSGQELLPVVDSGAATLALGATGAAAAARAAEGTAALQLVASGVVSGEHRDITITARLLPSRFSTRLLPPRITVKEAAG
jgi:hypothetical protein